MVIKLQPDQVVLFWDLIKHGVINAYKIPHEYQLDFTNKYLEKLLTGLYQCWVGYEIDEEGVKRITAIQCSRIIDEKEYGIRTFALIGVYGFRLISPALEDDTFEKLEEFARANGCNVMVTEYSSKRIGDMLAKHGFEKHITVSRKILT